MTDTSKENVELVSRHLLTHNGLNSLQLTHLRDESAYIMRAQSARIAELEAALVKAQAQARRYAGNYPQSSDARNTFLILADHIDGLALIPSTPTPEPTAAMFGLGGDNDDFDT